MKHLNKKKFLRLLVVVTSLIVSLSIAFLISINFIVNPVIYWLASTQGARIFLACALSWLGVSTIFDLVYMRYRRRKKKERFNALNVPYPRTFRGRK